ncbi:uncharacterized protein LOC132040887 [Lycium ferocissimum]|uniref:uncharacterized protein LOC132040887 n=1 Tax=Lycium ferocissimum TaxID=112874 RepID=UPI00281606C1|nr:uncharacterized protein LOC132040887 [Lycium ferocissimum]
MDLAKHAIQDYNNTVNDDYKYKVMWIEKVNYFVGEGREFLMTVKVENLTLRTPIETFQIHAYRGRNEENVARLCRKKFFKLSLNREEDSPEAREEAVELLLSKSSTS